ncbi:DUF805 domain-containing protein [Sphingomonas koreensis]
MDLFLRPWRHYTDFSGRSSRTEFWLFFISFYLGLIVLVGAAGLIFGFSTFEEGAPDNSTAFMAYAPAVIFLLAAIIPGIAVFVRRLHDADMSGWLYLLSCIPYLGWIFMIIFGFIPGTKGENRFGFDPRLGEEGPGHDEVTGIFS